MTDMLRKRLEEFGVALALLTRLPLPVLAETAFARQAQSGWAWPLAGACVGTIAVGVALGLMALGVPPGAAALVLLAVQIFLTGAMHEDGLADSADGLWGGWTPERRLEIMKDSRIGTYGVLALVVSVGLRWSIYGVLLVTAPGAVLAAALLSRAGLPAMMAALPNARSAGLSHKVGLPSQRVLWGAIAIAFAGALLLTGWAAIPATVAAVVSVVILGGLAKRKIGGQTGDILGATQQLGEILIGLTLLVIL